MPPKLYQTKIDPIEYGTYLATNSQGHMVLEMKGTGEVRSFKPDEIEEVVPYTVSMVVLGSGAHGAVAHISLPEGAVEPNDVILIQNTLYKVLEVNTRSGNPTTVSGPIRRVPLEKIA